MTIQKHYLDVSIGIERSKQTLNYGCMVIYAEYDITKILDNYNVNHSIKDYVKVELICQNLGEDNMKFLSDSVKKLTHAFIGKKIQDSCVVNLKSIINDNSCYELKKQIESLNFTVEVNVDETILK